MRELKGFKERKEAIVRKTEEIKQALMFGDQVAVRRVSDELLVDITESVSILEEAADAWLKELANDR